VSHFSYFQQIKNITKKIKRVKDIRKTKLNQSDEGSTPLSLPKWGDLAVARMVRELPCRVGSF